MCAAAAAAAAATGATHRLRRHTEPLGRDIWLSTLQLSSEDLTLRSLFVMILTVTSRLYTRHSAVNIIGNDHESK